VDIAWQPATDSNHGYFKNILLGAAGEVPKAEIEQIHYITRRYNR
jgi:hypothetical protein